MKFRFSISQKLLLLILPLVCMPIAIVGYFSIHASVERVDRLVRHEQMVEVKATAQKINDVLYYTRLDLETISRLPVLEDYGMARAFRLEAEAEFNRENIVKLFQDFIGRTTYYYRIRYLDREGQELVGVRRDMDPEDDHPPVDDGVLHLAQAAADPDIRMSDVTYSPARRGYLMHCIKPYFSGWNELSGIVIIELDFQMIIDIVRAIQVGERGYAFLVDQLGRNIAHPQFEPYRYHMGNYPDPSLRTLVREMMGGGAGWQQYRFEGEDKVAAFSFIPATRWSLAVAIPSVELRREAQAIQTRVIQVVLGALIFAVIGVSILSYSLLRPVRDLVTATHRMADGDMSQELPVQSRDELGDLTRSFNRMVKNLARIQNELVRSEKLISLGRLSAGVAHEIRNPLNAMKGAVVHMQRRRPDDPLVQEYTRLVSEEIDRLNRFVTEFLYFAKQAPPAPVPTDFNRLILSTQNLFGQQAREKGISFENHLDPDLPPVPVDPQQMEQVLMNLLINAMDAMPRGGRLTTITLTSNGAGSRDAAPRVRITLTDTGIGVAPEHMDNLFDPFFSTKETGTGLGLPLSMGIVEAHGGTLSISSREGSGTTVIIELPLETTAAQNLKPEH
ncbi:MAG: ATP-binding protein [Thermodesulfobacteriota bacterium]